MLKVVVDANVFISALLNPHGGPAQVFALIRGGKIQLLTSLEIVSEVKRVFLYPKISKRHQNTSHEVEQYLYKVFAVAEFTEGKLKSKKIVDDPADNKYLECAMEGHADFIISGDHHLKNLKFFQRIPILNPEEFLKRCKQDKLF
ncbi:MAG: putative toxin-antitoxin system toxin component, PIN family [Nitrospirae bacterium]|uniref:putative toxin-antitoxin system toxin component, PIN family n=1 Tax=Candidatus Magnetobacterium casense TaxID=1455061 RepID=UPI00058FE561|nr:putative toxin-antitoxin system toxin component, PIN family [Candidatus Magnetobacterium casensis]MBF0337498.1 putative toxin-antitoxin system toxin component, PIN family [Nitrospirota bacterium]